MATKKNLGLDLGTNSIGWALINKEENKIINLGSRIIPMGAEVSEFEKGNPQTKNAERRIARSIRRMGKRYKARRNKLLYILQKLNMLPIQFQFSEPFFNPNKVQKINLLPIKKGIGQLSAKELIQLKVDALTKKINLNDFGKIIFNYNQLRGYAGGGIDEDEKDSTENEQNEIEDENEFKKSVKIIDTVKIISLPENYKKDEEQKNKKLKPKYTIIIELLNENIEGEKIIECETILDTLKKDEEIELELFIRRGTSKKNKGQIISKTLSLPKKTNWRKLMEELETELDKLSEKKGKEAYLCEYFLKKLNEEENYKIRNKVILRKRYQSEFDAIWDAQLRNNTEFQKLVENETLLNEISDFIFPGNNPEKNQEKYRNAARQKGLKYLIKDQIIYYQRELQDQSHLIGTCRYEKNEKVIAKSHPIFQEFKVWEQVNKLSINTKIQQGVKKNGEPKYEYKDVPLSASWKQWLFNELQNKKEISSKSFYKKLEQNNIVNKNESFLNGIHIDGKFKGNETLLFLRNQLKDWFGKLQLDSTENLVRFWEILYNIKGDEYDKESERCKTIKNFIEEKCGIIENIDKLTIQFAKIKFTRSYASLSLKAIENILPLMRAGNYFNSALPENINNNITKIINEYQDDPFLKSAQELFDKYQTELLTQGGMQSSHAAIVVYGKHTAYSFSGMEITYPNQIKPIPQGQLRNPLAEQMINETLKMVKEIWIANGGKPSDKPNEIIIELARELKNSAQERNKIAKANENNRKINERVKQRLIELNKEISLGNIERYRLWSMQATEPFPAPAKAKEPTPSEIEKMRLWEEQKCVSPYTGQPIPLSRLFDTGFYDIDHIIPKSRYFDDSLTNKVVCERSVNIDKGNRTSWEYFDVGSTTEKILSKENFIEHINKHFFGKKRKNLLITKIPQDPIARQLKDTQYIAVKVREELSKIVGSENVKTTTGGVTDYLRHHWGLTNKFKEITINRFETALTLIKDEEKRSNTKWSKRIDHRHHAMDALIVACTEPAHIHRLNNLNKALQDWLKENKEKVLEGFQGSDDELMEAFVNLANEKRESILEEIKGFRNFEHPWKTFSDDSKNALESIIVSHKPKEKLLIQKVQKGKDIGIKDMLRIRGKLHDATLFGLSNGKEAYRIKLSKLAGKKFATEKTIEKIIDSEIKETIKNHLKKHKGNKTEAFSSEGINDLNKDRKIPIYGFKIYYIDQSEKFNLTKLAAKKIKSDYINDILDRMIDEDLKNKIISHLDFFGGDNKKAFSEEGIAIFNKENEKPIKAIKLKATEKDNEEEVDLSLLQLERKNSYNKKLLIATGSNYAFAVFGKEGKRHFDEISFFDATIIVNNAFKQDKKNVNEIIENYFENKHPDSKFLFHLKQNDMVYLPQEGEEVITEVTNPLFIKFWNDKEKRAKNVYLVIKFSGKQIYFIKHDIANVIANKIEFGSQNCYEIVNGVSIKEHCIKIEVDRLGNIKPVQNENKKEHQNTCSLKHQLL